MKLQHQEDPHHHTFTSEREVFTLKKDGILAKLDLQRLLRHPYPKEVLHVLCILDRLGISFDDLKPLSIEALLAPKKTTAFRASIIDLETIGLWNYDLDIKKSVIHMLSKSRQQSAFTRILNRLHQSKILSLLTLEKLSHMRSFSPFSLSIQALYQAHLLNLDNFKLLLSIKEGSLTLSHLLNGCIHLLENENGQQNFQKIIALGKTRSTFSRIATPMGLLLKGQHAQVNFDRLMSNIETLMLFEPSLHLEKVLIERLTQTHLDTIFTMCENETLSVSARLEALTRYIDESNLRPNQQVPQPAEKRPHWTKDQSTHNASVHETASHSALHLKRVCPPINLLKVLDHLSNHLTPGSKEWLGFKNFVEFSDYRDELSGIYLVELAGLAWASIHHSELRLGGFDDAKQVFFEGLLEIQRDNDVGDIEPDTNICASGAFNKIIEKLIGIIDGVSIVVINKTDAAERLGRVVPQKIVQHLSKLSMSECQAALSSSETISALWPSIRDHVVPELEVYRSIYLDEFDEFIDFGKSFEFSDSELTFIEQLLMVVPKQVKQYLMNASAEVFNESLNLPSHMRVESIWDKIMDRVIAELEPSRTADIDFKKLVRYGISIDLSDEVISHLSSSRAQKHISPQVSVSSAGFYAHSASKRNAENEPPIEHQNKFTRR